MTIDEAVERAWGRTLAGTSSWRGRARRTSASPRLLRDLIRSEAPQKGAHEWQQPLEEAVQFVKTLSDPGDLIADLFVCSGTVPAAVATVNQGRRFVGCEIDGDLVKAAKRRVRDILTGTQAVG